MLALCISLSTTMKITILCCTPCASPLVTTDWSSLATQQALLPKNSRHERGFLTKASGPVPCPRPINLVCSKKALQQLTGNCTAHAARLTTHVCHVVRKAKTCQYWSSPDQMGIAHGCRLLTQSLKLGQRLMLQGGLRAEQLAGQG